jgi:hypothetical protein
MNKIEMTQMCNAMEKLTIKYYWPITFFDIIGSKWVIISELFCWFFYYKATLTKGCQILNVLR